MGEADVDTYLYHSIFDISQFQHRKARGSKSSNKKSFTIKFFHFWDIKKQKRYILQEEVNISKRERITFVDSLRVSLKTFDHATKCIQVLLPKPKVDIGSTKWKDNLFAHYYKDIIEHPNRQIRLSFRCENNNSCLFSIKKIVLYGNQFIVTEIVNHNHREIHHLYKNRHYLAGKYETIENNYDV